MPATRDPYYEWLGIPPKDQPPNHYRLLGLELFEENRDVIATAADRQMSFVKSYQCGEDSELSQDILNELSAVRLCLLNPDKKAAYDTNLRSEMEPPNGDKSTEVTEAVGLAPWIEFEQAQPVSPRAEPMSRATSDQSRLMTMTICAGLACMLGGVVLGVVLLRARGTDRSRSEDVAQHGEQGTTSRYLDQACVYCNGLGHVPCPDRGCSRGTVGSTRADTVGRNTVTGQAIVKIVPIRVACSRCRGKGSVDCGRCSNGTMTRIR